MSPKPGPDRPFSAAADLAAYSVSIAPEPSTNALVAVMGVAKGPFLSSFWTTPYTRTLVQEVPDCAAQPQVRGSACDLYPSQYGTG